MIEKVPSSRGRQLAAGFLSALPALAMTMSAFMKFTKPPAVVEAFTTQFGYPESTLFALGVIELLCVALYTIPRTTVLGAILTTGYLGGAIATHVRVSDAAFVSPLVLGVLVWAGLYLRDERLRALIPLRQH